MFLFSLNLSLRNTRCSSLTLQFMLCFSFCLKHRRKILTKSISQRHSLVREVKMVEKTVRTPVRTHVCQQWLDSIRYRRMLKEYRVFSQTIFASPVLCFVKHVCHLSFGELCNMKALHACKKLNIIKQLQAEEHLHKSL